jgi:hypothetical protein
LIKNGNATYVYDAENQLVWTNGLPGPNSQQVYLRRRR